MKSLNRYAAVAAVGLLTIGFSGCNKSNSNQQANAENKQGEGPARPEASNDQTNESSAESPSLLQKTGKMVKNASDSSFKAANHAGAWVKETVQDGIESGTSATVNAGNLIREMFQNAKEQGMTTANNVVDFVKEDFSRLGAWEYTSRTVTEDNPEALIITLNKMGKNKWECFWVDRQSEQTVFYFKRSPRSYVNSIPFKDLIRYLPELGGAGSE